MTATLEQLEARLEALEAAQVPQLDTLTPTYLTVNPDGTIGADFTGVIHALGLTIPAGFGSPTGENEASWTDSAGAMVGSVNAYQQPTSPPRPTSWRNQLTLVAALVGDAGSTAEIWAQANTQELLLLNDSGSSSYVQTPGTPQKIALDCGTDTLTWAGSASSTTVTVTHGLGRTPKAVLLTLENPGSAGVTAIGIYYAAPGATTFAVLGIADVAMTDTIQFGWLAIG